VQFEDAAAIKVSPRNADLRIGPGTFNLKVAGPAVTVSGTAGESAKNACVGRFVAFPLK
jgi:hypothetical protein